MALRKMTDLTAAARKGLTDFLEDEEGGTGKNAALSAGLLVGGTLIMQVLATQVAYASHNCAYAQDCPAGTDYCYRSSEQWAGCGKPHFQTGQCKEVDFCADG